MRGAERVLTSEHWERAGRIAGAQRLIDDGGVIEDAFGAHTSGQTLVYSAAGELLFSGGVTRARGHTGENAGIAAIAAILEGAESEKRSSHVFGCEL